MAVGVSLTSVQNYEGNKHAPPHTVLSNISEKYGVQLEWLMTGHGPQMRPGLKPDEFAHIPEAVDSGDLTSIPFYEVRAGAGHGQVPYDENAYTRIKIDKRWLASKGVKTLAAQLLEASGDSMEPTIGDGDLLIIDTSERTVRDAIYVLRRNGNILVKRLQRRSDGSLSLLSDNPIFAEERVPRDDAEDLQIIGRVALVFKTL